MVTPADERPSQVGGQTATLIVEFTGLCLYAPDSATTSAGVPKTVSVYMPDCRRSFVEDMHTDGTRGEPHVGYLSIPLAHLGVSVPPDTCKAGSPKYATLGVAVTPRLQDAAAPEVVYQFDRQELDFGVAKLEMAEVSIGVPGLGKITDTALKAGLENKPGVNGDAPPELLFRTKLSAGKFVGRRGNGNWTLQGSSGPFSGQFSEVIIWTVENVPSTLTITLSSLYAGGPNDQSFTLQAVDGIIRLKVANLCSINPLEWDALTTHLERHSDDDFKWLYRLLDQPTNPMPVPVMVGFQAFGWEDCLGACKSPTC